MGENDTTQDYEKNIAKTVDNLSEESLIIRNHICRIQELATRKKIESLEGLRTHEVLCFFRAGPAASRACGCAGLDDFVSAVNRA